jgi:acetyl esterase/lipase
MTVLDEAALAEARSFNEALAEVLAEQPQLHTVPPERSRRARREGRSVWPKPVFMSRARDLSIPARSGEIRVRVLAPDEQARGVYLYIHGGGWVLGSCDEQDDRLWALVEATGLCAVSVDYRLSPEHPYPAGPDDCEDAAVWLLERGLAELDVPDRIAIGGESAGAHLAVTTLLRLRDRHGVSGAFQAANLDCGVYDLSGTPSNRSPVDRHPMLSTADRVWFSRSFTGDRDLEGLRDPDLSPLYAQLHDLPAAIFTVGELDPLLDDSQFMAGRWQSAGNRAQLRVWPESLHGFSAFPIAVARAARDAQHEFLRGAVSD